MENSYLKRIDTYFNINPYNDPVDLCIIMGKYELINKEHPKGVIFKNDTGVIFRLHDFWLYCDFNYIHLRPKDNPGKYMYKLKTEDILLIDVLDQDDIQKDLKIKVVK
jgi:hypothetical protein